MYIRSYLFIHLFLPSQYLLINMIIYDTDLEMRQTDVRSLWCVINKVITLSKIPFEGCVSSLSSNSKIPQEARKEEVYSHKRRSLWLWADMTSLRSA